MIALSILYECSARTYHFHSYPPFFLYSPIFRQILSFICSSQKNIVSLQNHLAHLNFECNSRTIGIKAIHEYNIINKKTFSQ